ATIAGFVCIFLKDKMAVAVAVGVFCAILLAIAIYIFVFIYQHLKQTKHDFIGHATFVKYETEKDGKNILYEVYRQIQSKQLVMTELDYAFKWTGSKPPIITSHLQKTDGKIYQGSKEIYDHVKLILKKPLVYNETGTIHFNAKLDDYDDISKPYVEFKVEVPVDIVHFRIILKNKSSDFCQSATIKRRNIFNQTGNVEYETLQSIPFNTDCKSYEYHLLTPEVGYFYRIEWVK
ncbi:MAG: hypothetical protein LBN95_00210, partial [Prevotellaceae bacterium]|nr:hypothetical protein [Prevotellaceae bacterium]